MSGLMDKFNRLPQCPVCDSPLSELTDSYTGMRLFALDFHFWCDYCFAGYVIAVPKNCRILNMEKWQSFGGVGLERDV